MFEAYGIKVSSECDTIEGFRLREYLIAFLFDLLDKKYFFSAAFAEGFDW